MQLTNVKSVVIHYDAGDRTLNNISDVSTDRRTIYLPTQTIAVSRDISGMTVTFTNNQSRYYSKNNF